MIDKLKEIFQTSEIIKSISTIKSKKGKSILFGDNVRALKETEIKTLQKNGCWSQDWLKVLVTKNFDARRVANSTFFGDVIIGDLNEDIEVETGVKLPAGIFSSTIVNSEIGNNAFIKDAKLISNYIIKDNAIILNVGTLSSKDGAVFGNGIELPIAIETGGREVLTYAEITIDVATKIASTRDDKELLRAYEEFIKEYCEKVKSTKGIVEKSAVIKNTPKVMDTYVGEGALIDNANLVQNVTMLSSVDEKAKILNGSYVVNSILQWGSDANSMSIVDSSVLTEHSHAERHGKVTGSILGPNSGVAEGECTASLCGPFVGFHHQALLIAAFWPEGKGNVGYGANVGSNHTSKAPDQEIWCGEGTFFGLGVNIKFPSDFTKSPYSIIATAVNALPQRIEFPFSLINSPADRYDVVSPAYNEIMPGWVLSDNIYTVKRNEGKYIKRNKAKRSQFVFEVFRPDIIDLMIDARKRLQVSEKKEIYTDKDIKGLGKNYMLEASRVSGIEAYTFYIKYYALLGLKRVVAKFLAEGKNITDILDKKTECPRWENERAILKAELPNNDIKANLKLLIETQEEIAKSTQVSKEKDDKRGARTIKDYSLAHKPASEDSFVKETWKITNEMKAEIEELLKKL
jgi:NDP-sugar pyrophosphorylase family protein